MTKLRTAGRLILPAVALMWLGQLTAMIMWDGTFMAGTMYISDLGARECQVLSEATVPRVVCSPGHIFYMLGMQLAGLLLLVAATALRRIGVDRRGAANPNAPIKGIIVTAFGIATTGICLLLNSMLDVSDSNAAHHIIFGVGLLAMWVVMVTNAVVALKHQPLFGQASIPLLHTPQAIVTLVLTVASISGYLLFVFSPPPSSYGLFQHIAVDSAALWMLLFASVLLSTDKKAAARKASGA